MSAALNESGRAMGSGGTAPRKSQPKAYRSSVAVRSDTIKYRAKYRDLKKKVADMEAENDRMHAKTLILKRKIQRARLERTLLYERMLNQVHALGELGITPEQARLQGGSSTVLQKVHARNGAANGASGAEHGPGSDDAMSVDVSPRQGRRSSRGHGSQARSPAFEDELLAMRDARDSSPRGPRPRHSTRDYSSSEDDLSA